MLDPGISAVGRVLTELDPFLAQETKDTIRLYLADEFVSTKGSSALFGVAATGFVRRRRRRRRRRGWRWRRWWRWWRRVIQIGRTGEWRRFLLTVCTMLEPFLDGLEMIGRRDVDPLVTEVAENTLCIEFADIGVLSKEIVALFEGIDILAVADLERCEWGEWEKKRVARLHFLGKTGFAMSVPGNGTIGRVGSKTDPLVTGGTENAVGFKLSDIGI